MSYACLSDTRLYGVEAYQPRISSFETTVCVARINVGSAIYLKWIWYGGRTGYYGAGAGDYGDEDFKDMTKAKGQIVPLAMVFIISLDLLMLGREVAA